MSRIPVLPLLATLLVQALCTMAVYSVPVVAPVVAVELGIPAGTVGLYAASVYGLGMASALLSPGFVHRFGAIRVSQVCLLTAMAGIATAALGGGAGAIALSALVIASGYGATAPASSHLIVKRTPPELVNIVFSIRQTGVPLGGVGAGLIIPPLLLWIGWREALLLQLLPCAVMMVALQLVRADLDADRDQGRPVFREGAFRPLRLIIEDGELRRLSLAAYIYSGAQLCFGAFLVVYLTGHVGLDLVRAGQALASYQISGVCSRIALGWLADRFVSPRLLLGSLGVVMATAAVLTGMFAADWPFLLILAVCMLAGATASGFTGIAYAEYSRLGGPGRTAEATGAGAFAMFFGSMSLPAVASVAISLSDSYTLVFDAVAVAAAASGLFLLVPRPGALLSARRAR